MRRLDLVPDCGSCAAVCCIATSFETSDDFAFDKVAGEVCRHLDRDFRCAIHDELVARGCAGCAIYDCYGAGQRVTRWFGDGHGVDATRAISAFLALRVVHELLWLLTEAAKLCPPLHIVLRAELARTIESLDALASGPVEALLAADMTRYREVAQSTLRRVGDAIGGRRGRLLVVVP